jgi:ferredoxin
MLTSADVKQAAKTLGADLCGIASMDRFEGAPKQQDPRYIFPDAKALIALAFRIPRGYYRGIEEGTFFTSYMSMGYGGMNVVYMPCVLRELCCFIEDHRYEAAPIPNDYPGASVSFATSEPIPDHSRPVREGLPNPDVLVDFRIAAFAAGLGEIGYSKILLTPEFGPRQRFVLLLTDAPLEPDPIVEPGTICDRCMRCVEECSGDAISADETDTIEVAGRTIEWGKLDVTKCSIAYRGGRPEYNPFMKQGADPSTWEGKYCGYPELDAQVGGGVSRVAFVNGAIEGARGCVRACMIHLEETGRLSNEFENPFRTRKPWRLGPAV